MSEPDASKYHFIHLESLDAAEIPFPWLEWSEGAFKALLRERGFDTGRDDILRYEGPDFSGYAQPKLL